MSHEGAVRSHRPLGAPGVTSIVAICTVAVGLGATLGFVPGYVATQLQADFDISRARVGLLISVFFGATGLGSILGGRLTDRLGARRVVAADLTLVAACSATGAWADSYAVLLVMSVISGAGYAWANAGTNLVIARHIPARRRTVAMSVKTAGVPGMAGLAAALATPAASRWSWHAVWWSIALVSLLAAVVAWTMLDDDRPAAGVLASNSPLPRGFWWFPVAAFLLVGGSQPFFSWLVPYLEEGLELSAGSAGAIASVATGVGLIHLVVNGVVDDRRGPRHRVVRIAVFAGVAAAGGCAVASGLKLGPAPVAVGAAVGLAAQLAAIGTMHAALVDRAPRAVARATGVTMTGYYLGALVSPFGFGALVDATGSYGWAWLAMSAALVASVPAWLMCSRVPVVAPVRQRSPRDL